MTSSDSSSDYASSPNSLFYNLAHEVHCFPIDFIEVRLSTHRRLSHGVYDARLALRRGCAARSHASRPPGIEPGDELTKPTEQVLKSAPAVLGRTTTCLDAAASTLAADRQENVCLDGTIGSGPCAPDRPTTTCRVAISGDWQTLCATNITAFNVIDIHQRQAGPFLSTAPLYTSTLQTQSRTVDATPGSIQDAYLGLRVIDHRPAMMPPHLPFPMQTANISVCTPRYSSPTVVAELLYMLNLNVNFRSQLQPPLLSTESFVPTTHLTSDCAPPYTSTLQPHIEDGRSNASSMFEIHHRPPLSAPPSTPVSSYVPLALLVSLCPIRASPLPPGTGAEYQ